METTVGSFLDLDLKGNMERASGAILKILNEKHGRWKNEVRKWVPIFHLQSKQVDNEEKASCYTYSRKSNSPTTA